ncbi:MAG: hypothetical protein HZB13_15795 [Acidobacteria bacterium]|nr:hypothetical protein [Acidobacteriota bacterium]
MRTRKRPNSDIETCVRSSLACALGNASYRSRLRLDWDHHAQRVIQDAAAPFLDRQYRDPWKLSA